MMDQPVLSLVALGFVLIGAISLTIYGMRYRNQAPKARSYSVFRSLSDEVGRVAEEGSSIHIALGNGSLTSDDAMTSIATLQGLNALIDLAAAYDTPPLITTSDPALYLLASDWMRRAYARLGSANLYRSDSVRFTAASPATYAAMAASHLFDGQISSNLVLGAFAQEVSLLAEAAERKHIHSSGGTVALDGLGALYPILNSTQLIVGEDMFAGGAEVTQRSSFWASLWAQDVLRWLVVVGIVAVAVMSLLGIGG